ncbi:MAG TPA: YceI family protein [Candidatus Cybelea sp.]
MIVIEDRRKGLRQMEAMPEELSCERFEVSSADSSLTFFATSTLFPVYGKATEIGGFVEAAWNENGTLSTHPVPRMHVELKVESLKTGNELQDREMWKLIDSRRFPKIVAELRELSSGALPGRYNAAGQITLAGLARRYEGELLPAHDGDHLRIGGEINVDVRDFGLKSMNLLVLSVEPLVRVRLRLVAKRVW